MRATERASRRGSPGSLSRPRAATRRDRPAAWTSATSPSGGSRRHCGRRGACAVVSARARAKSSQLRSAAMSAVLVTGATGFMGRALVARLLDEGRAVRILERRPSDPRAARSVERVTGDVTQTQTLAAACAGAETVFNLAGVLSYDATD